MRDPLLVAAAWSRLVEPGDTTAGTLVSVTDPVQALLWAFEAACGTSDRRRVIDEIRERIDPSEPQREVASFLGRLDKGFDRWAPRLAGLDPAAEFARLERLGGQLLIPGTPTWPTGLDALGVSAPFCLWARGEGAGSLSAQLDRSVALVGARACTEYGTSVSIDLASGLADRGFAVVSGGAYGIDAAAHRGALAAGGLTFVLLAGGVDRLYPAGNARLLAQIVDSGGAVVSEVPPGAVPSRSRFLQRNRLIAALSSATVVVEAAWRSGALSTATHAQNMFRPVGAVPGPVTSMASAGCHRLLREQNAVCVTDASEVAELAGVTGKDLADEPGAQPAPYDGLSPQARGVYDALPLHASVSVDSIARSAGFSAGETMGGLGDLVLRGLAVNDGAGWRRVVSRRG